MTFVLLSYLDSDFSHVPVLGLYRGSKDVTLVSIGADLFIVKTGAPWGCTDHTTGT